MSATLSIHIEGQPPDKVPIGGMFAIGRAARNDFVLDEPRISREQALKVSRYHALIRLQDDGLYYVVDLGSVNGTLLNGQRVTRPVALKPGDRVQVANCQIRFLGVGTASWGGDGVTATRTTIDKDVHPCTVSVLVADIRRYTLLSERIPPEALQKLIQDWFRDVSDIIHRHDGTVDKFIGDAVMAFWLEQSADDPCAYLLNPLKVAQEILHLAPSYDRRIASSYAGLRFAVGCGVSAGRAIMGNVGGDPRQDFTVMGDCVNIAFRVESLCVPLGRAILVTEEVRNAACEHFPFDDLGFQTCKGKSESIQVFALRLS